MLTYEGSVPSLKKVELSSASGERLLPMDQDFMTLRTNDRLEVGPGDRITVDYEDPSPFGSKDRYEAYMQATYTDGQLLVGFPEGEDDRLAAVRRFAIGDDIRLRITDPDLDISNELDRVVVKIRTSAGKETQLEAIETDIHSGSVPDYFFPG